MNLNANNAKVAGQIKRELERYGMAHALGCKISHIYEDERRTPFCVVTRRGKPISEPTLTVDQAIKAAVADHWAEWIFTEGG